MVHAQSTDNAARTHQEGSEFCWSRPYMVMFVVHRVPGFVLVCNKLNGTTRHFLLKSMWTAHPDSVLSFFKISKRLSPIVLRYKVKDLKLWALSY